MADEPQATLRLAGVADGDVRADLMIFPQSFQPVTHLAQLGVRSLERLREG